METKNAPICSNETLFRLSMFLRCSSVVCVMVHVLWIKWGNSCRSIACHPMIMMSSSMVHAMSFVLTVLLGSASPFKA